MNQWRLAVASAAAIGALAPISAHAADVPKGDISYKQVQDLANQGLIDGYTANQDLFQGRTVNRYELAALVARAAKRVSDLQSGKATGAKPSPAAVAELNALVQSYGVELAIEGADVPSLRDSLKKLSDQIASTQKQIDKADKTKVASGYGTIKFDGLFQAWYLAGDRDATNFGSGPGTGLGLTGSNGAPTTDSTVANTFRIRRAELRFSGNINQQAYWQVMFDPTKNQNLSVKNSIGTTTVATNGTSPLQDYFVGWHLNPQLDVEVGQQKVPLTIDSSRSSANLLFAERALFNQVAYNQGRVADIRDLGLWLRYNQPSKFSIVGAVLNDAGNRQNLVDDNNTKEVFLNGQYFVNKQLQVGAYGESQSGVGAAYIQRKRIGADVDYTSGPHEFVAEYVEGYDGSGKASTVAGPAGTAGKTRLRTQGSYAAYAYKLSNQWQVATRWDYFNPDRDRTAALSNIERDYTLGVNYFLAGNNSKIQLNYIKRTISGPLNASGQAVSYTGLGRSRSVVAVNFQQAW
ncbi:MAG TPA: porin [Capsulimonadaceae bacterium]|jgi:hypothetical protein